MTVAVITGAGGLIGSAAAARFAGLGLDVVGVDNDMRATFFGPEASTAANLKRLSESLGKSFTNRDLDIRNEDGIHALFGEFGADIGVVVHTAAQPSHDWAAREPLTDFGVNAVGTLNLLEATRTHCPEAPFIFCSTNKVYGDTPNRLPLEEHELRYEVAADHTYFGGIREDMSIDHTLHSLFGVSKTAADLLVQEYGRYFGMPTVCFRGGTLTGPAHAATELHGFLGYVMRCTMTGTKYTVFGYKGKQVRDAIHSIRCRWRVRSVLQAHRVSRRSTTSAADDTPTARYSRRSRSAKRSRVGRWSGRTTTRTASAITSGGSATTDASRSTTRRGRCPTTSRRSCTRSTTPTSTGGSRKRRHGEASATALARI